MGVKWWLRHFHLHNISSHPSTQDLLTYWTLVMRHWAHLTPSDCGCGGAGGEITWIKWNLAWFALARQWACTHLSAYGEACLRSAGGGGLLGAHQSMPRPLQPHIKLKSVPHCVCVNDPGGTPTPAAPHTFPSTCLLCPGCGPVREDYAEECSRAHLLKQGKGAEATGIKFMFNGAS